MIISGFKSKPYFTELGEDDRAYGTAKTILHIRLRILYGPVQSAKSDQRG